MGIEEFDVLPLMASIVDNHQVPRGCLLERQWQPNSGVIGNRHLLMQLTGRT